MWANNRCAWNFIIDALQNHLQNVIFNYIISSIIEYHECPKGMFQSSFLTGLMTAHSPVFTVLTPSFPVQKMSFFYFKLFKKKKNRFLAAARACKGSDNNQFLNKFTMLHQA